MKDERMEDLQKRYLFLSSKDIQDIRQNVREDERINDIIVKRYKNNIATNQEINSLYSSLYNKVFEKKSSQSIQEFYKYCQELDIPITFGRNRMLRSIIPFHDEQCFHCMCKYIDNTIITNTRIDRQIDENIARIEMLSKTYTYCQKSIQYVYKSTIELLLYRLTVEICCGLFNKNCSKQITNGYIHFTMRGLNHLNDQRWLRFNDYNLFEVLAIDTDEPMHPSIASMLVDICDTPNSMADAFNAGTLRVFFKNAERKYVNRMVKNLENMNAYHVILHYIDLLPVSMYQLYKYVCGTDSKDIPNEVFERAHRHLEKSCLSFDTKYARMILDMSNKKL